MIIYTHPCTHCDLFLRWIFNLASGKEMWMLLKNEWTLRVVSWGFVLMVFWNNRHLITVPCRVLQAMSIQIVVSNPCGGEWLLIKYDTCRNLRGEEIQKNIHSWTETVEGCKNCPFPFSLDSWHTWVNLCSSPCIVRQKAVSTIGLHIIIHNPVKLFDGHLRPVIHFSVTRDKN